MRWFLLLTGVSFALIVGYWISPVRIAYTFDQSLPYKWWIELDLWREPKQGDYVLFEPPVRDEYTQNKLLVKRIVCGEGQYIRTVGKDFYCNDVYLGRARETDSKGRPVKHVQLNQVINRGYYFVMGTTEKSYDSRYMGLIPRQNIRKLMIPLSKSPDIDFLFLD